MFPRVRISVFFLPGLAHLPDIEGRWMLPGPTSFHGTSLSEKPVLFVHGDDPRSFLSAVALASSKQYHHRASVSLASRLRLTKINSSLWVRKGMDGGRETVKGEWLRGMGEGNGFRPVVAGRETRTRRPAGRRVLVLMALRFRLRCFIRFAVGTHERDGGRACSDLFLSGSVGLSRRAVRSILFGICWCSAGLRVRSRSD